MALIYRIGQAVVVAIAVGLLLLFLGIVLVGLKVDIAVQVGDFLKSYGFPIGVLAGLAFFFFGGAIRIGSPPA